MAQTHAHITYRAACSTSSCACSLASSRSSLAGCKVCWDANQGHSKGCCHWERTRRGPKSCMRVLLLVALLLVGCCCSRCCHGCLLECCRIVQQGCRSQGGSQGHYWRVCSGCWMHTSCTACCCCRAAAGVIAGTTGCPWCTGWYTGLRTAVLLLHAVQGSRVGCLICCCHHWVAHQGVHHVHHVWIGHMLNAWVDCCNCRCCAKACTTTAAAGRAWLAGSPQGPHHSQVPSWTVTCKACKEGGYDR